MLRLVTQQLTNAAARCYCNVHGAGIAACCVTASTCFEIANNMPKKFVGPLSCHSQFPAVQQTPLPQTPLLENFVHLVDPEQTPLRQVPPVQAVPSTRLVMGLHCPVAVLQPAPA